MNYDTNDEYTKTILSNNQKKFIHCALKYCNPKDHYEKMVFHHGCVVRFLCLPVCGIDYDSAGSHWCLFSIGLGRRCA